MPRKAKNSGTTWTTRQHRQLKQLARGNTPTRLIAWKLGRSTHAVYAKASELGVSLKPTNQPPYNRRKK